MQQTRREFLDEFLGFVGELGDDDARDVAEQTANRVIQAIWTKYPWSMFVSPAQLQLTLAVNQRGYALPDHFGRFGKGKVRNLTQGCPLTLRDLELIREDHPDQGTTREIAGQPELYCLSGMTGVSRQPLVAGDPLEVLSDNAADVDVVVEVAGDDATGRWTRNQVTLNGTTPIAIGTWSYIDEFSKAYPDDVEPDTPRTSSRGNVTLRKVAGAVALESLFSAESSREHRLFTVYPKPNAADVLGIPFLRRPKRLLHDADLIPLNWGPAIFEEMLLQWRTNTGEVPADGTIPRPALNDLIALENASMSRRTTRPFFI